MQLIVQREKVGRERPNTGERWRREGEYAFRQETNSLRQETEREISDATGDKLAP